MEIFVCKKGNTHLVSISKYFYCNILQKFVVLKLSLFAACLMISSHYYYILYKILLRHTALPNPAKPKKNVSAKSTSNVSSVHSKSPPQPPLVHPPLRNGHPPKNHHLNHHHHNRHPSFNHSSINVHKAS